MSQATLRELLRLLHKSCGGMEARVLTDAALLERFLRQRDEQAFTLLVERHGPMVLEVCQRILADTHAAEDAFQAAFLVLARRASSIRKKDSVGSWLYGVAQRIAHAARASRAVQRARERQW